MTWHHLTADKRGYTWGKIMHRWWHRHSQQATEQQSSSLAGSGHMPQTLRFVGREAASISCTWRLWWLDSRGLTVVPVRGGEAGGKCSMGLQHAPIYAEDLKNT